MSKAPETSEQHGREKRQKLLTIYVNTRPLEVDKRGISFEDVVTLAYPDAPYGDNTGYSVMYEYGRGGKEGTLVAGQSVKAKHGMRFDVTATDRS